MAYFGEKRRLAKKRKAEAVDEHEEQPKKQKPLDMSETEFKNLLKDDNSINSGLEEFASVAEAYRDGQDCLDIVSCYCSSSPECSEIFNILDKPQKRANTGRTALVYECLTHILQYVRMFENSKLWSTADFIVEKFVASYLDQMYNYLRPNNITSTRTKKALHLLISMVTLNTKAKRTVLNKFKFDDHLLFQKLFQGRDRQDPEDVRSCIVLFTMSFIVDEDDALINSMVQQKSFIQMTIAGLNNDPKEMVIDVLATLLEKVVLNAAVLRPNKLQLFDVKVLMQLCKLYDWEGPRGWKNDKKLYLGDADFLEERSAVSNMIHEVLLAICSRKKTGLAFLDKSLGTGTRNFNPLMTRLLHFLSTRLDNVFKRKLAANILNFCPDQLSHFLPNWGNSLMLQGANKRTDAIDFLVETYKTQMSVPSFLSNHDTMPGDVERLISLMTTYYLPCESVGACIKQGVEMSDLPVRHQCLVLVQVILQNVTNILSVITSNKIPHIPSGGFSTTLATAFSSCAMTALPTPTSLFNCVGKVLNILSDPKKLEAIGTEVDLVDHVSTVLKMLTLYQRLSPTLLSDRPNDVANLVEAVGLLQAIIDAAMEGVTSDTESKVILPQLDLLKLFSETDVKSLPLVEGGLLEKLLRSASGLKDQHKEETVSLIYKVLTSLEVLSDHKEELSFWISQAMASESEWTTFSPIGFLSGILGSIITSPIPFLDRVMEITSETESHDKGSKKGSKNKAIQDILDMDEKDFDLTIPSDLLQAENKAGNIIPFSPLTVAALEKLGTYEGDTNPVSEYVNAVMVAILHSQSDPVPYSLLVTKCWVTGHPGVKEYFDYWTGNKKKPMPEVNFKIVTPYSCHLLNWFMSDDMDDDLDTAVLEEFEDISEEEKLSSLKQAILYMEHCFSDRFALGQKMKRVGLLRKMITNIFTNYVNGFNISRNEEKMDVDVADDINTEIENTPSDHHDRKGQEKISAAVLYVANSHVVKEMFLSSFEDNLSSPLKSNANQKLKQLVTELLCDVLAACKDITLSHSCTDVLEYYLERALEKLKMKGKDLTDCLTAIQAISCHAQLPAISKCISSFLQFLPSYFVDGKLTDGELGQLLKGQKSLELTTFGEVFLELLDTWKKTLSLYHVTGVEDKSLILNISSHFIDKTKSHNIHSDRHSHFQQHPYHVTTVSLNTSGLGQLFNLLLVCSNFDSSIVRILQYLPQLGVCCSQDVFKKLIKHFTILGKEKRAMVEVLISSHELFHKLGGGYILKHAKTVFNERHFSLVRAYLENVEGDATIIQTICENLLSSQDILSCEDDNLWACLYNLIDRQDRPDNFLQDLFLTVKSFIPNNRSSTSFHHFSILNAICTHQHKSLHRSNSSKTEVDFLELVLKFITHLLKRTDRNFDLEDKLIDLAKVSLQRGALLSRNFLAFAWAGFVKSLLKHLYKKPASLDLLAKLMHMIFGGEGEKVIDCGGIDPLMTFQMCVNHTAFLPTLMSATDISAKDSLVNLLHTLFTLQPSCVTKELLTPLAGTYSATLSLTDQRLLSLMNACLLADKDGGKNNQLPVLWGKAYLDQIANSKSLGNGGSGGKAKISMDVVLGEIDPQKMEETILHFAQRRKIKEFDVQDANELMSKPDCFDPSYLLRVFLQILSPEKIVQVRGFSEKNCLGFLLVCLSSKHHQCRLMAYKCLNDFYAHLENTPSPARHEFAFILDILNASRDKHGQRIHYVMALYLSRAVKLVLDPADHLYLRVIKFLCHESQIDLNSVPEFYKFFFSSGTRHFKERTWMLTLLRDGLRDNDDYQMYRKCFVFKHLMSFHSSFMSDKTSKVIVLELIRNACRQAHAVHDLMKDHGLIPWLTCVVSGLGKGIDQVEIVSEIIDMLCKSLGVKNQVEAVDRQGVKGHSPMQLDSVESLEMEKEIHKQNLSKEKGKEIMDKKNTKEVGHAGLKKIPNSTLVSLDLLVKTFNSFVCRRRSLSRCV